MNVRQVTTTIFVILTSSSYTASVSCVQGQLPEMCVTNQGALADRRYTESYAQKDLYRKMFVAILFIIVNKDRPEISSNKLQTLHMIEKQEATNKKFLKKDFKRHNKMFKTRI